MRKKTMWFEWTMEEYLKESNVTISIQEIDRWWYTQQKITAQYWFWAMENISFTGYDMETVCRMVVNFNLSYLWDKAQYTFIGRTKTFNF